MRSVGLLSFGARMLVVGLAACVGAPARAPLSSPVHLATGFGVWTHDPQGLPAFDLLPERMSTAPYAAFAHLISAGRAGALVDRWGNVRLITTEGGTSTITPVTTRTRGGLFALVETNNEVVSFVYSELSQRGAIRYGTGYATYEGSALVQGQPLALVQEVAASPQDVTALAGTFTLTNRGTAVVHANLVVQSDVFVRPGLPYADFTKALRPHIGDGDARFSNVTAPLGDVYLLGPKHFRGETRDHSLRLQAPIELAPGHSVSVAVSIGYGNDEWARLFVTTTRDLTAIKAAWGNQLQAVQNLWAPEPWMKDEAVWSFGQLLSFRNRDASLDAPYYQLGGYSMFRNPDNPEYLSFPVREGSQNALGMAAFAPDAAKDALRWVARGQLQSGDIPKTTTLRADRDLARMHFESDGELWFLLASVEQASQLQDLFDETWSYWDGGSGSYFEHLVRAYHWVRDDIGVGAHGLVLMKDGDWNDYLSRVGRQGRGESFMNTAMAIRACEGFA